MDLYKYLENVIDKRCIEVFKDDEYELALVRYVLKETSKLFYRNAIFFLNEEHIKERYLVYDYKFNPKDITSFEIVSRLLFFAHTFTSYVPDETLNESASSFKFTPES